MKLLYEKVGVPDDERVVGAVAHVGVRQHHVLKYDPGRAESAVWNLIRFFGVRAADKMLITRFNLKGKPFRQMKCADG